MNIRTVFTPESIATLANLLCLQGQKEAIRGYLSDDGEWFEFTDGERRYRAWEYARNQLGVDLGLMRCELEEKVDGKKATGASLIFLQLSHGTDKEPLCVEDQALAIKKLIDEHGVRKAEIAKKLCCSDQHIRDLLKFLEAPEDIKQAVREKAISHSAAVKTTRARTEAQTEVRDRLRRGEKVTGADVSVADGKLSTLSVDEIQAQIKKADALMLSEKSEKGKTAWQGVVRGLRIAIRLEDKLK